MGKMKKDKRIIEFFLHLEKNGERPSKAKETTIKGK
jgi:hypothetical protein